MLSTNLMQARSDRMAKGRIWVISKQHRGYTPTENMYSEMETMALITEVMQDTNKVSVAISQNWGAVPMEIT